MSKLPTVTLRPEFSSSRFPDAPINTRTSRKRDRCPDSTDINIYVDSDDNHIVSTPPPKKSKRNSRIPLSIGVNSTNISPASSPLGPDIPFSYSSADPFWCNKENYDRHACYITPPPTPNGPSLQQSPYSTPLPTPFSPPTSSPRHFTRIVTRPRSDVPSIRPPAPKDMTLYSMLGLDDYQAIDKEIRAAYRKTALNHHPDRVDQEQRCAATLHMQQINAARDVLLNKVRRKHYHKTGKLPWAV